MKRTLTALTVAASMFASNTLAFDPAHLQELKDTNICVSANPKGCNLSGAALGPDDLTGANLRYANLSGAFLVGAKLSFAILCNSIMPNVSLNESGC